jgi:hypothetical protein
MRSVSAFDEGTPEPIALSVVHELTAFERRWSSPEHHTILQPTGGQCQERTDIG